MSTDSKIVLIASDHNGNEARDHLVEFLLDMDYNVVDLGPRTDILPDKKVDYTDYAEHLAYAISKNKELLGILICGTGIGMSIAANRFCGVNASLVTDSYAAEKTREHNNSNVLVMGAWKTSCNEMEEIVSAWLNTDFGKGRHEARVAKLGKYSIEDIVLVPGVFEVLHPGHIELFEYAKTLGKVVVAINSDDSAFKIKGNRPRINEQQRADIISSISYVDEVLIMDDEDAGFLLKTTNASYIVKGGTQDDEELIREKDNVPDECEIKIMPMNSYYSSEKIRSMFSLSQIKKAHLDK